MPFNGSAPAYPCGLVAKSLFNDTYALSFVNSSGSTSQVFINESNIAWESDVKYKFKNAYQNLPAGLNWTEVQWTNVEDGKDYGVII